MPRTRLLFEKTGRAQYISHLDLLRTFQRVFIRAGVKLRHTEGFNPHPYMSFALPLPVGMESICELLDFDLAEETDLSALPERLNAKSPEGIRSLSAYLPERKFQAIAWVAAEGTLIYDGGVPEGSVGALETLFHEQSLVISKKTKKGFGDFDVIPHVRNIRFDVIGSGEIRLHALVAAQNPSLNPDNLIAAVRTHLPSCGPDFASFKRVEIYDENNNVFR